MALINPKEVKVGEAANLCRSVSEFEQKTATHSSILACTRELLTKQKQPHRLGKETQVAKRKGEGLGEISSLRIT